MTSESYSNDSPFQVGQVLTVTVEEFLPLPSPSQLRLQVKSLIQPCTLSCGLVVEVLEDPHNYVGRPEAFLKLYDRRFASQLPFAQSGEADKFLQKLQKVPDLSDNCQEWDGVEDETFLAYKSTNIYTAETLAYGALRKFQGKQFPQFYAAVSLATNALTTELGMREIEPYMKIRGILIEYIPGFSLKQLHHHTPQSTWQGIIDQAIQAVHLLGDRGVLNRDVRPDNFIVSPIDNIGYRVVMIDLGLSRLRETGESDFDWGREKWFEDEEGAVGLLMRRRLLREAGFQIEFHHSLRYLEWAQGENDY